MVEQDDAAADAAPAGIVIAGHQRADAGVGTEDPGAAHDRRQLFAFAQQGIDFRRRYPVVVNVVIRNMH